MKYKGVCKMAKGMFLNGKDLSYLSNVLWGEISSLRVLLKTNPDNEQYQRDFSLGCNLYCKISRTTQDELDEIFRYIDIFSKYKYVKSFGIFERYSEIYSIERNFISTCDGAFIGWGIDERSVFIDDKFYPYGIEREDVIIAFK